MKRKKNSIINELFYGREEDLAKIETKMKNKLLSEEQIDIDKEYSEVYQRLSENKTLDLLDKFNLYLERRNHLDCLCRKRYYKEGVKDVFCMIYESIAKDEDED